MACRQGVSRGVVIRSRNAGLRVVGSAVAFPPSRDNEVRQQQEFTRAPTDLGKAGGQLELQLV